MDARANILFDACQFSSSLREKAQSVLARVDSANQKLATLPRHMQVEPDVFDLVTLMLKEAGEIVIGVNVELDRLTQFFECADTPAPFWVKAKLAHADQQLKHCFEILGLAQKMTDGEVDCFGNLIPQGATWRK
jgi:hypothetical protein